MTLIELSQTTGQPPITHLYRHCGVDSGGTPFIIILALFKGGLIIFNAFTAFQIRGVSSAFNESAQLGYALYNCLFSLGIVLPLMFLIQARGDALVVLIAFVTLWISYATMGFLFVPKLLILLKGSSFIEAMSQDGSAAKIVSNGFSFLSTIHMTNIILERYIAALETHLDSAKRRLKTLKNGGADENEGKGGNQIQNERSINEGTSKGKNEEERNRMKLPNSLVNVSVNGSMSGFKDSGPSHISRGKAGNNNRTQFLIRSNTQSPVLAQSKPTTPGAGAAYIADAGTNNTTPMSATAASASQPAPPSNAENSLDRADSCVLGGNDSPVLH
jgi:hypothetical protein